MSAPYRVAVTRDGARPDGSSVYGPLGLDRLEQHGIQWRVLPSAADPIPADELADVDAVWSMMGAHFDAALLDQLPRLRHIARFGAGFDTIDVPACTRAGVAVTNTPDAVRRPLALAALTLLLACAHSLPDKQQIVRTGAWDEREQHRGHGIAGKTLGIVGYGSVGRDLAGLAAGIGLRVLAHNRRGFDPEPGGPAVEFAELDGVLARSDYVVLAASLNEASFHLIDEDRLRMLRPDAYLINVGRGALIDEAALVTAVRDRWFAGAALDVFEQEPLPLDSPLHQLDNLILTPHSLCWTEELGRDCADSAIGSLIDASTWTPPRHLVNPDVLRTDRWRARAAADRSAAE